jgi:hypothetical protein
MHGHADGRIRGAEAGGQWDVRCADRSGREEQNCPQKRCDRDRPPAPDEEAGQQDGGDHKLKYAAPAPSPRPQSGTLPDVFYGEGVVVASSCVPAETQAL